QGAEALAALEAPPGRGRRCELAWRGGILTLIDESYNARPPAMCAALSVLAATAPGPGARRGAVLGDMLEIGDAFGRLHRDLVEPLAAAGVDRVFLVGQAMTALHHALPDGKRGGLWQKAEEAVPEVSRFLEPGDVVTVKGSRGVRVSHIVERLCAQSARPE